MRSRYVHAGSLAVFILLTLASSGCISYQDRIPCGSEFYNTSTQSCCGGEVYNGTMWTTCGNACYHSEIDACCDGIVYNGTEWMKCGNICFNSDYGICENGTLQATSLVRSSHIQIGGTNRAAPTPSPSPALPRNLIRLYEDTCVPIEFGDYRFCDPNPPRSGINERIYFDDSGNYYSTTVNDEGWETDYRPIARDKSSREMALDEFARRCTASPGCRWTGYNCYCKYPDGSSTMISYL